MRLIDADALPRLMQIFEANGKRREQEVVLAKIIDNAPTIDAVPVVRCKDCGHYDNADRWCSLNRFICGKEDFCTWGRKDDGKSCDTCKYYDKWWDDNVCDGCTEAHSNWERKDDECMERNDDARRSNEYE